MAPIMDCFKNKIKQTKHAAKACEMKSQDFTDVQISKYIVKFQDICMSLKYSQNCRHIIFRHPNPDETVSFCL